MLKKFALGLILLCCGCVIYLGPTSTAHNHGESVSADDIYIGCDYDTYWQESIWEVEVYSELPHGYYEEEVTVEFYVDDWYHWMMDYSGGGFWYKSFNSTYYHCYEAHSFEIIVSDIYGGSESNEIFW